LGGNSAEPLKQGYGSKRVIFPMVMMITTTISGTTPQREGRHLLDRNTEMVLRWIHYVAIEWTDLNKP
jgi:hypothetical protein